MVTIPDEVKALFSSDTVHKNFHVTFPNGETTDLNNENVISESVKFTESLCSQQYFKFGLAEASQIEFVSVGIPNVRGAYIECAIEIDCTRLGSAWAAAHPVDSSLPFLTPQSCEYANKLYYRIPYGRFKVDTCPRDHGAMWQRQITAYSDIIHSNEQLSKYEIAKENAFAKQQIMYTFNLMKFIASNVFKDNITAIENSGFEQKGSWTPAGQSSDDLMIFKTYISSVSGYMEVRVVGKDLLLASSEGGGTGDYIYKVTNIRTAVASLTNYIKPVFNTWGYSADLDDIVQYFQPRLKFYATDYAPAMTDLYEIEDDDFIIYPTRRIPVNQAYMIVPYYLEWKQYDIVGGVPTIVQQGTADYESRFSNISIAYYDEPSPTVLGSYNLSFNHTLENKVNKVKYYSFANAVSFTDLATGMMELCGWFLKPDRNGALDFFQMSLSPTPISVSADDWESFWWDETPIESIGQVNVIYTKDNEEQQETFSIGSGNSVYTIENNEVLKSAEMDTATMESILTTYFAPNASVVNFTPVDLTMRGLPFLESGDYIELTAEDGETVDTYILNQTISGIQHLTAEITSTNGNLLEVIA